MEWVILIFVFIYSFYYKNKILRSIKHDGKLTGREKANVIITEIFNPVIAGAIYYYGWKKSLPIKAKQANKYSWIIVGSIFVLAFLLISLSLLPLL